MVERKENYKFDLEVKRLMYLSSFKYSCYNSNLQLIEVGFCDFNTELFQSDIHFKRQISNSTAWSNLF